MRCPNCGSLTTKKNGSRDITPVSYDRRSKRKIQRYLCLECKFAFSKRKDAGKKYTTHFKAEIARMHVEERQSYRVISKRIKEKYGVKISPVYLCKMVNEIADKTKSSIEIKEEFHPLWEGYLTVDDKYINIKGVKQLSLVAVDSSGDIIHFEVISEATQDSYDAFFMYIKKQLKYTALAITTDLDGMLEKSVETVFGAGMLHQKCVKHALDNIMRMIDYKVVKKEYTHIKNVMEVIDKPGLKLKKVGIEELTKYNKRAESEYLEKENLLSSARSLFYSKTKRESGARFRGIKKQYSEKYPEVLKFIERNKDKLLSHIQDPKIPKTNNFAENINRQLMRRLKTIESFQNYETAFNYLNLYRNYLRFKPYTDCKGRRKVRNGKSPLEICSVHLVTKDWIKNSLNYS
jgi:transposase-like protein